MQELKKDDWVLWGRWIQPVLSGCFWSRWFTAHSITSILPNFKGVPVLFLDGYTLLPQKSYADCKEIVSDLYQNNTFGPLCDQVEIVGKACEDRHLALSERKSELTSKEYVQELFDSYTEMVGVWTIVVFLSNKLEELVFEKGLAKSEEDLMRLIGPYHKSTWLEKQNTEIRELALSIQERGLDHTSITVDALEGHPDLLKRLESHIQEFDWFGTHHWVGEPYSLEKGIQDIRTVRTTDTTPAHEPVLTDEHEMVWKTLALFAYWRTHSAEVTAKTVYRSRDVLEKVAQEWGMTYDDFVYLSSREIEKGMEVPGAFTLPPNFHERKAGYGCNIDIDGVETITTGDILQAQVRQVIAEAPKDVTELKGTIASKGSEAIVRAPVSIILAPEDIHTFTEGNILVVPETTPDFVPVMKLASAIVTEVGGITSHAAIVSRELKKPCITGTKIATQVLKNGDVVEVNTNTGVVSILVS